MCLIKGVFVGEKNLDVIKMHGTAIKKKLLLIVGESILTDLLFILPYIIITENRQLHIL